MLLSNCSDGQKVGWWVGGGGVSSSDGQVRVGGHWTHWSLTLVDTLSLLTLLSPLNNPVSVPVSAPYITSLPTAMYRTTFKPAYK